MIALKYLQNK